MRHLLYSALFASIFIIGLGIATKFTYRLKTTEQITVSGTVRYEYHTDAAGQESMFKVVSETGKTYHVLMKTKEGVTYDTDYPSSVNIIAETFFFAPSSPIYRSAKYP